MELKTKAQILVEFIDKKSNEEVYDDFFAYNDLGLPLAVALFNDLCELNQKGIEMLNETYLMLLTELQIEELDKEFNDLDEIFSEGFVPDEDE